MRNNNWVHCYSVKRMKIVWMKSFSFADHMKVIRVGEFADTL